MECKVETTFLKFLQQIARIQHIADPHNFDRMHPLRIALLKSLLNAYINEQQIMAGNQTSIVRL